MKHWLLGAFVVVLIAGLVITLLHGDAAAPTLAHVESAPTHPSTDPSVAPDRHDAEVAESSRQNVASLTAPAARPAPGRPHGRVIDKQSSSSLAFFRLELPLENGELEALTTDANGEFASASVRAAGPLSVKLLDVGGRIAAQRLNGSVLNWNEAQERKVEWNGKDPIVIAVDYSVVVPLRFTSPAGLTYDDFGAELFDLDPRDAPVESALMSCESRVRGAPPFARFRSLGFLAANQDPKLVRITSNDGFWRGSGWSKCGPFGYEQAEIELVHSGRIVAELV